jgi:hypothetical protein
MDGVIVRESMYRMNSQLELSAKSGMVPVLRQHAALRMKGTMKHINAADDRIRVQYLTYSVVTATRIRFQREYRAA